MFVSRKRINSITPPSLYIQENSPLQQVDSVKYLGVVLTSDLTWSEHISNICSEVRKLIGLLYRHFHHCSPEVMLRLYRVFIRPHLEYARQVWDPYFVKDIETLERCQKFALRVSMRGWSSTY